MRDFTTAAGTGGASATTGSGAGGATGAGGDPSGGEGSSSGGCGCSMPGGATPSIAGVFGVIALAALRRRRR
ncbi:MAG: MYXO-CTERM sorting domain-containing protein [Minicystis sp.]